MAVMMVGVTALGTFHPEANPALAGSGVYGDRSLRAAMALRVLGAAPSIAAMAYHKRSGGRASQPNETLGEGGEAVAAQRDAR